jgi:hypothetical protein
MRVAMSSLALAAGLTLALLSPARAAPDAAGAALDRQFVCPESLPSDAARQQALRDFVAAYAKAVPTSTVPDMLLYRRALLATHGCRQTSPASAPPTRRSPAARTSRRRPGFRC